MFLVINLIFYLIRPLGPTSVIPAVTAFLNRLLFEIEEEKLQKGRRF